jgi:uncharacterized protein YecE (DUF72 family)
MPRVHIGQATLQGHLERYAKTFDFVEVKNDPALLSPRALKRLAGQAPEGFAFSLVLPKQLAELAETPAPAALEAVRAAADTLGARFVLVRTPASFTPSARSRARLARLAEGLRGKSAIAWEPRGIWTDEEIAACAAELELVAVRDLAEQDPVPGPIVYTRLLALGRNARVGSAAIERVSERLEGAEEAFVIVEGQGAAGVVRRLRGDLAPGGGEGAEFEDGELDDGDDEFEDEDEDLEADSDEDE